MTAPAPDFPYAACAEHYQGVPLPENVDDNPWDADGGTCFREGIDAALDHISAPALLLTATSPQPPLGSIVEEEYDSGITCVYLCEPPSSGLPADVVWNDGDSTCSWDQVLRHSEGHLYLVRWGPRVATR